jgi:hypothetical protein
MSNSSWDAATAQLAAAQRDFMNRDATGLQRLYSHRDDVTVMGGFGGFERGWAEVGPRLAGRPHIFTVATTVSRISVQRWAPV